MYDRVKIELNWEMNIAIEILPRYAKSKHNGRVQKSAVIAGLRLPTNILYEPRQIFELASAFHGRMHASYYSSGIEKSITPLIVRTRPQDS